MAETIKVFPGAHGADLSHPSAGPIKAKGSMWPQDQFTFRRLRDGSITQTDPEKPDANAGTNPNSRRLAGGPDKV